MNYSFHLLHGTFQIVVVPLKAWSLYNAANTVLHRLLAPPNSGSLYYNYKSAYSVIFLVVVDMNYYFSAADHGTNDRNSDGGTTGRPKFYQAVERSNHQQIQLYLD
jgi:DDE superfamily endonuclease